MIREGVRQLVGGGSAVGKSMSVALISATLIGCSEDVDVKFSNVRVEEIGPTSAIVRFDTSIPTTCEVRYGLSAGELAWTATDPNMDPSNPYNVVHEVPLTGLLPETAYFYQPVAKTPTNVVFNGPAGRFITAKETVDPTMVNVARSKEGTIIAGVSSNFAGGANASTWGAEKAIDGDSLTEWATAGDGDNAWLALDLGKPRTVSRVALQSRRMSDGTSIIKQVRLLFDDGVILGTFDMPDPGIRYVFDLTEPAMTRQVRLEATSTTGGNTGLKEFELFEVTAP